MLKIRTAADTVSHGPNGGGDSIVIGIVNNMPDAAIQATERQFCDLLAEASEDLPVRVRLFSMPELRRSEAGQAYLRERYEDIGELFATAFDGLIVTGAEPRAPQLPDEPYWPSLTRVVDWAEEHTISTLWSCLAAHAVVLHRDGIQRRPFREKLSGVFDCEKAADHRIIAGAPPRWSVPHSRYNDLPEDELIARGYCIVSRSQAAGADMFVKQGKSLSIFLQGHPEYDREALFREYRRDIRGFVAGERDRYPEMPRGYFDDETAAEFDRLRRRTSGKRGTEMALNFPEAEKKLTHSWHEPAVRLYKNWLSYLVERKRPGNRRKQSRAANVSRDARTLNA